MRVKTFIGRHDYATLKLNTNVTIANYKGQEPQPSKNYNFK